MAETAQAIVFCHGLGTHERGEFLGMLADGIRQFALRHNLAFQPSGHGPGRHVDTHVFRIGTDSGSLRRIDLREAYWGDLQPSLSRRSTVAKAKTGVGLLVFWLCSWRTWSVALSSKYMLLSTVVALLCMLFWYAEALGAALVAFSASPHLTSIPPEWLKSLLAVWTDWHNLTAWAIIALLMGTLPVSTIVDIAYATKSYIENELGMSDKVQERLLALLHTLQQDPTVDGIVVVAYSFGTVPAVEALAHYPAKRPIRLVTLGSPLQLIAARAPHIGAAIDALLANPKIEQWGDFHSDQDWLCTGVPASGRSERFVSRKVEADVSLAQIVSGQSHTVYFHTEEPMAFILAQQSSAGHSTTPELADAGGR